MTFAEDQDGRGHHRGDVRARKNQRHQHQCPARPDAPPGVRRAEDDGVHVSPPAERGRCWSHMAPIEADLFGR